MTATTTIVTGMPRAAEPAGRRFDWGQPFVYLLALVIAAVAVGPVLYVFIGGFMNDGLDSNGGVHTYRQTDFQVASTFDANWSGSGGGGGGGGTSITAPRNVRIVQ